MTSDDRHDDEKTPAQLGGEARAKALTPEERRNIATRAAATRWRGKPLNATHKGNFEKDFGFDVDCYVLDDEQKSAVVSQRGMGAALGVGAGASGRAIHRIIQGRNMSPFVGAELAQKIENPLIFQAQDLVRNVRTPLIVHGYDVTILIDVCKAIIAAESAGALRSTQARLAKQAHVIVNASAKAGIKGLVYALAGYDATKEEVISAFKFYVREEAREYEKEFPSQLYEEWYRLYQLPRPERNKPWKFKHLTIEQVYVPLAKSNGKILQLMRAQKAKSGDTRAKLHQFLEEIGVKALRTHLGRLLGIAELSPTRAEYEYNFQKIFGRQPNLPGLITPTRQANPKPPALPSST